MRDMGGCKNGSRKEAFILPLKSQDDKHPQAKRTFRPNHVHKDSRSKYLRLQQSKKDLHYFICLNLQSLGSLQIHQPLAPLQGNIFQTLMGHDSLERCSYYIVNVTISMTLGCTIRNPKIFQNLTNKRMPMQTPIRIDTPQSNLARILPPDQIRRQPRSIVPIHKENIPLSHSRRQRRSLVRGVGLGHAEPRTTIQVPRDDEGAVSHPSSSPLNLLDTVHSDDGFTPRSKGLLEWVRIVIVVVLEITVGGFVDVRLDPGLILPTLITDMFDECIDCLLDFFGFFFRTCVHCEGPAHTHEVFGSADVCRHEICSSKDRLMIGGLGAVL